MNVLLHIFYKVSGMSSAFYTALILISRLGNNYFFMVTSIFFGLAAAAWHCLNNHGFEAQKHDVLSKPIYIKVVVGAFYIFVKSVWTGLKITFSSCRFIWFLPGYVLASYAHQYLKNAIAPVIARHYLGNSVWAQIIVGSSNFGELIETLFMFLFINLMLLSWLCLHFIMLLMMWYLPFWHSPSGNVTYVWIVLALFAPISLSWAVDDVSLAAYIQAMLATRNVSSLETGNVSSLGAVMSFLYLTYIVIYAVASPTLGHYINKAYAQTGRELDGHIQSIIQNIAGMQFSVLFLVIFISTFILSSIFALNPNIHMNEENLKTKK